MAKKIKKQRPSSDSKTGGKEASLQNLKGNTFRDKPERINKKGRPKLIHHITAELKEKGYEPATESQIIDAYQQLLNLPEEEISIIRNDKTKPYFLRLVAQWMGSKRGMEMMDRIMDRSYGKTLQRQSINASIKQENNPEPPVDKEALLKDITAQLKAIDDEGQSEEKKD